MRPAADAVAALQNAKVEQVQQPAAVPEVVSVAQFAQLADKWRNNVGYEVDKNGSGSKVFASHRVTMAKLIQTK